MRRAVRNTTVDAGSLRTLSLFPFDDQLVIIFLPETLVARASFLTRNIFFLLRNSLIIFSSTLVSEPSPPIKSTSSSVFLCFIFSIEVKFDGCKSCFKFMIRAILKNLIIYVSQFLCFGTSLLTKSDKL